MEESEGCTNSITISIGEGFYTDEDWKLGDAQETLLVGVDATFKKIETFAGNDSIEIGHDATLADFGAGQGHDTMSYGSNLDADDVKMGKGNDLLKVGYNDDAAKFSGGGGQDMIEYGDTSSAEVKNFEYVDVVCIAAGALGNGLPASDL